ncbi:IS3 family transposase [Nonomuraea sp. NPDC049750]|uniref:IS3 family transposase n=1 Tax=Nonomuraea sp. NPDC049750 TaxID=3154738 RepID=UPI0033E4242F
MSVAAFISSQKTDFGIDHVTACRALGVSQSWFYKWNKRVPTAREQRRIRLDEEIKRHFEASGGTYGSPRITQDLHAEGWKVSENTVAKRMAELGLAGRKPRKPRSLTRQGRRPAAPDLVGRKFTAVAADVLWVGDGTMIDTDEGPLYLATVEDLFSRRLLGFAMSEHHDAALTVASLQMAVTIRGGDVDGVIFHSDRGSEYTAARYQATRLNVAGMG